jgi:heme oxygenase
MATKTASARSFLKEATRGVHDAAHELPLMRRLADGSMTRADYETLTRRLYTYYAIVDQRILAGCDAATVDTSDFDYEPRAPLIAGDLVQLNLPLPQSPRQHGGLSLPAPLDTPARVAGAAYVVEGSLLGAKLLDRALPYEIADARCRAFWTWCADAGPRRWAMTRAFIERACTCPATREEARGAAFATFALFHAVLSQPPPRA